MKLIVDANIIFAALIKNNKTFEIFFDDRFTFYAPDYLLFEFEKYRSIILKKSKGNASDLDNILKFLIKKIIICDKKYYDQFLFEAKEVCPDIDDVTYFALAIKLNCAIWSNDKALKKQNKIEIISTSHILKFYH